MSDFANILGINTIEKLNNKILNEPRDLIYKSEQLHNLKIKEIADNIIDEKMIFIAGPSSSGKTTFANKLANQLKTNFVPIIVSMDNFFVERENTPLDNDGKPDYESIEAIDLNLFEDRFNKLLNGKNTEMPIYNFSTGKKEKGPLVKMEENGILIIEGIHGLNPILTKNIDNELIFRIYEEPQSSIVSSELIRKARRILRDVQSRDISPLKTLEMWPSISRGEKLNIFPYIKNADVIFNTHLTYEFAILKNGIINQLKDINSKEAYEIVNFLNQFEEIDINLIPKYSIIREFIGWSIFYNY